MPRKRVLVLVAALLALSLAASPLTDDLLFHDHREHVHKVATRNLDVPPARLTDLACEDGRAGPFACDGIDLLAFVPDDEMFTDGVAPLGAGLSDIWGWTDPETGSEYVLFGKTNATAVYDVTDPIDPVYLGEIPNPGPAELIWHDIKIDGDHAFIVSETPGHGVQVFDLTTLRGLGPAPVTPFPLPVASHYAVDGTAHNIVIDTDADVAYVVGSGQVLGLGGVCTVDGSPTDNAGLHAIDISDPLLPTYLGCYAEDGYIHDAHCATYTGPDTEHQGRSICVTSNEDSVSIVDVTDPTAPTRLSRVEYPGVAYSHQGWMSEDQRFYFHGDELDEDGRQPTRTLVFDIRDLDDARLHFVNEPGGVNIDHNMYTHRGMLFQSNYTAGLQVFDTSLVEERELPMIAWFDTFPDGGRDAATFDGTWSNYPYFASGTIAVTGIGEGLFLLRLQDGVAPEPADAATDG